MSSIVPEHGIVRNDVDDGWYVLPVKNSQSPKPFFDVSYRCDPSASYAAAKEFNAILRPYKDRIKNYRRPRSNKSHLDLPVGITLATVIRSKQGQNTGDVIYNFKVSTFNGKSTTVYIGTERTWLQNYDNKLKKAMDVRRRFREPLLKTECN
ncbi:hypothetical protein [Azotobacter armeniacus]